MKILLLLLAATLPASAQKSDCKVQILHEGSAPVYPPIARAAHIMGRVVMSAQFLKDGTVSEVKVESGHQALQKPSVDYVKSWRANPDNEVRNCSLVINFVLIDEAKPSRTESIDSQHVNVYAPILSLNDPPGSVVQ